MGLRIWHPEMERNVVLVPDLQAYRLPHPTALPGLEGGFVLPGWHVGRTFFAYRFHDYRTDFGVLNMPKAGNFPELTYNATVWPLLSAAFFLATVFVFY